jgi:hypothetical protein
LDNIVGFMDKIVALIFISLLSCSSSQFEESHEIANQVKMKVESISNENWRVTYSLPEKVLGVYFYRQTNQFRKKEWRVLDTDLVIEHYENSEIIYSKTKKKFNEIIVEFAPYYKTTPKDYEFFQPFSDGGILFYTGHLLLQPMLKKTNSDDGINLNFNEHMPWTNMATLKPIKNGSIVVNGKINQGTLKWHDKNNKGTYVYFGNIKPLETEAFVAILDSGLPPWVIVKMREFLPKLFSVYSKGTQQKLSFKPVVYFNYKPTERIGTGYSGGTLPGLVQLTIEGTDWRKENNTNLKQIVKFLGHESAHFWNGQMFNNIESKAAWVHEGGADAFSYRALYKLGIINKKELWENYNNALSSCLMNLDGKALNSSEKSRSFRNYYDCGSTIMLMVESALLTKYGENSLFEFWEELLGVARKQNNQYDSSTFHSVLRDKFSQQKLSNMIKVLEGEDRESFLSLFKQMGSLVNLKVKNNNKNAPAYFLSKLNQRFFNTLMQKDCGGKVATSLSGKGIIVFGNKKCNAFKQKYDVISIEGVKLTQKTGNKGLLFAKKACKKKGKVRLGLYRSSKFLFVPCKENDVRLNNWFEFIKN